MVAKIVNLLVFSQCVRQRKETSGRCLQDYYFCKKL